MAVQRSTHPSADALKAFGLGKLDDNSSASVMSHLDQCDECRNKVAALSGDDFLQRLRQAHSPSSTPAPAKSLVEIAQAEKSPASRTPIPNLPSELANNPQYEILRELGRGGMGVVYLARNKAMDRLEVLKVVNKELLDHPGAVERFLREIRAAAKLSHTNVVAAYSVPQMGELLGFAMEYVEGQDLASLVKTQGPLPIANACFYVQQAALGLQHAFDKKMVHRDIKPQNLILAREGKKHLVKVLDFGLAKVIREKTDDTGLTGKGKMLGTPDYIAPEQTLDAAKADIRADIYSLGCTLYYLLSGSPPFSANSLGAILLAHQMQEAKPLNLVRPEVPEDLATMVRKMMAKSPAQRYQTPREVVEALAPFIKQGAMSKPSPELSSGAVEPKPAVKRTARVDRPAEEAKMPPEPAVVRKSLPERGILPVGPPKNEVVRKRRLASEMTETRRKWLMGGGLGVGVLLLALLGMWAGGVFKVKVRTANGQAFIVLQVDQPGAEVLVDGEKITVNVPGDNQPIEIKVAPGRHQLEVKKGGFKVFGQSIELQVAEKSNPIEVQLTPVDSAKASANESAQGSRPADALKREAISPDLLAQAGSAATEVPPELVTVLGDGRMNHWGWIRSLSFDPDGKTLASSSNDGTARLWSVSDGRLQRILGKHERPVRGVAFSPDGRTLAMGSEDGVVRLWDVATDRLRWEVKEQGGVITDVRFSPNSQQVAAGVNGRAGVSVKIWEVATGRLERTFDTALEHVHRMAFSPDGKTLAAGGGRWWGPEAGRGRVKLWDLSTGQVRANLEGHTDFLRELAFSPDGKWLATASQDRTAKLWNWETGQEIHTFKHGDWVLGLAFSPDGKSVATSSSWDKGIRCWDVVTGKPRLVLTSHMYAETIAFSPDGQTLALGHPDHTVGLWEVATGRERPVSRERRRFVSQQRAFLNHFALSPDGKTLVSGGNESSLHLWDMAAGRQKSALEGRTGPVYATAISPDGRVLASGSGDRTIRLWDLATGQTLKTLTGNEGQAFALAFSSDGQLLASGSRGKMVRLWDVANGKSWLRLAGHGAPVRCLAFSPDGKMLASGSGDKTVKLWDAITGELRSTLEGHGAVVRSVTFAADGQTLISAGDDKTVRFWDVAKKQQRLTLEYLNFRTFTWTLDHYFLVPGRGEEEGGSSYPGRWLSTGSTDKEVPPCGT